MALGTSQHDPNYTTSGSYNRPDGMGKSSAGFGGSAGHEQSTSQRGKSGNNRQTSTSNFFDRLFDALFGVHSTTADSAPPVGVTTPLDTPKTNYKTKYPQWASVTKKAAQISGISEDYFDQLIHVESRGNAKAKAKSSSAAGLFQFTKGTAKDYGLANPYDPDQSAVAVGKLTKDNYNYLSKQLGRSPTKGELYLAHQQGKKGAADILRDPNGRAVDTVGRAAVVNNGGKTSWTNAQFASLWTSKFDRNPARVGAAAVSSISKSPHVFVDNISTQLDDITTSGIVSLAASGKSTNAIGANFDDNKDNDVAGAMGSPNIGSVFDKLQKGDIGGSLVDFTKAFIGGGTLGDMLGSFLTTGPLGGIADLFGIGNIADSILGDGASDSAGDWLSWLNDLFLRIVIIVLGIVFVAVGLALFKPTQTLVKETVKAAK